jgi:hypothetical protein
MKSAKARSIKELISLGRDGHLGVRFTDDKVVQ